MKGEKLEIVAAGDTDLKVVETGGCSSSPWDDSGRDRGSGGAVEEFDWVEVLPEIGDAGDAGEADRTVVLSEDQHPGCAGETDGMNELSEIEDDGSETDRLDALSEVGLKSCAAALTLRFKSISRPQRSWWKVSRLVGWTRCRRSGTLVARLIG